ncbi:GH92 family glycosyl hydrolase [Maribellus sp. CM-23]|uniref:GH92 family glycosyl hydrolase n=1 Tax=Maribellus sp. CM-23 TaxID=2781026 RepID=UPI0021D45964|nr:GH92 family glycosyl hydrolase [Maribellus sp. CM-23]MCE4565010.1 GH92 family glycosyl hydrolase [Maribellus sp. CM-23]
MSKHVIFLPIILLAMMACSKQNSHLSMFTSHVNPFIGTDAHGHTYPGALVPFGMVQLSPDTDTEDWDWCSGYHASDNSIMGFSHLHVSGTGIGDMGDILFAPVTGDVKFIPGPEDAPSEGYRSGFSKDTEISQPGYYSVELEDYGIKAELTASKRVGFHKYTFQENKNGKIIIDLDHGIQDSTVQSYLKIIDSNTVAGYRNSTGFVKNQHVFFYAQFSKPFESFVSYVDGETGANKKVEGQACKVALVFGENDEIKVKVGISTASEEGAAKNIKAEIPGWDFEEVARAANNSWETELAKVEIDCDDIDKKTTFYTALYHNMVSPNLISDVDGHHRGWDGEVHKSDRDFYTNYSLWDTYRGTHPLHILLNPDKNNEFINSMLQRYNEIGELPINEYGINETFCMIGNHSIPVIVDAYLKGVGNFDAELAYEAIKHSSTSSDYNFKTDWEKYMRYGYLPADSIEEESVSRTLELCYNDWCVALMAKKMGKTEDYEYFSKRAGFYKNLFDKNTSFMRGRNSDGSWDTPFDPFKISHAGTGGGNYTEGNAWHYTWHVQHDVEGLIDLLGGPEKFTSKLDSLFILEPKVYGDGLTVDVTGLIGQYVHGNEPCHHVPYLYAYAGQPWRTQEIITEVKNTLYKNTRDGLCGNDDCGQMSAWYIFGTLGFYPLCPGSDSYVIGTPSFSYTKLKLPNGNDFIVKANNLTDDNYYIQSTKLNGKKYTKSVISYDDVKNGGVLEFTMGPEPKKD